jgi:hypothetical protein
MLRVSCPVCGRKLRVPDDLASRRVRCPECEESVRIPLGRGEPEAAPSPTSFTGEFPLPARLGIASVALGLLSVMVLCLPFVGFAAVGLSGLGMLLGLGGLFTAFGHGTAALGLPAGGARGARRFGEGPLDYPLAGIGACVLALALAILPWFLHD